jgi:membrane protein
MAVKGYLKTLWRESRKDELITHAAALSFYILLALIPLTIIVLSLTGFFISDASQTNTLIERATAILGNKVFVSIKGLISAAESTSGINSTFNVLVLLLAASILFGELRKSLNRIWRVEEKPLRRLAKIKRFLKRKLLSFIIVIILAIALVFIILLPLIMDNILGTGIISTILAYTAAFLLLSAIFTTIFTLIPDIEITYWQNFGGGIITAILVIMGQLLLSVYFKYSAISQTYGTSANLIILVLWVYYSTIVFLIGAEISYVTIVRKRIKTYK